MRGTVRLCGATAAAVVCAIAVAGPLAAESDPPAPPQMCPAPLAAAAPDAQPTLRVPILVGGQRAYIDPVTGGLIVPARQQARRLEISLDELAALSKSSRGLETFALPGGGVGVHLAGRFQVGVFATVGEDGKLHFTDAFGPATPPASSSQEERP